MRTPVVRPAAVAGVFYPDDPRTLEALLTRLLVAAGDECGAGLPKVLVVPHAGYVYSGQIAARAYATLRQAAALITRVVLLGPCHRVAMHGIALPQCDAFATPLGTVALDRDALARVRTLPGVCLNDPAHAQEHSLEVQLPFLQQVLDDFALVPLAVGNADPAAVANVLDALWGGPETLIVISTDLSHYHGYLEARQLDAETVAQILQLATPLTPQQACGAAPLNGLMEVARRHRLDGRRIDLCNSGDTAGERGRVVGYCALAFRELPQHAH